MARRTQATIQFDALSLEGGLLPPEWLGRVAALEAPAQAPADYGIKRGLQLRDEITRFWRIAEALWADFAAARGQRSHDPAAVTLAFVRQLLTDVFEFTDLEPGGHRGVGGRDFTLAFEAVGGHVPVVVGPATEKLDDSVPRHGDGSRRRSAWGALQEYLNAFDGAVWGLASNGLRLRLGRDNASLTRPAWLEADLERIFTEERFADFSVLWLVLHASRFGRPDQPAEECPLEAWRAAASAQGSRAREALRTGVEAALRELGQGFLGHSDNAALREQLAGGTLTPQEYFNELLRLVYRAIFLLTVEEREILHVPAPPPEDRSARAAHDAAVALYAEGYGMRRLRERAVRRSQYDRHTDLWASLRPVFTGLGRPEGEPALRLPGLGGLFAPEQCPHLDACVLENRVLLSAVYRLAWLREGSALVRVNWKDMGPEELGSVYESLLELVPQVSEEGRRFGFAGAAESAGNARKLTGSYYTPDTLVQQLLDTALEPVVRERLAAHPADAARALLSISVVDPACGSGHFLLAAARRLATHLARLRAGGTPGPDEYRHALRDVVTHCIHGVDRNPMALELARMALWLEAYTPDRALGFLDHHLVCGDALLGLLDLAALKGGIPAEAFKALTGDDKEVAKALAKRNRAGLKELDKVRRGQYTADFGLGDLGDRFAELDAQADDGVLGVEEKRRRYLALHAEAVNSPAALAADCYLAAFLSPKTPETAKQVPATGELAAALDGTLPATHSVAQAARRVCREAGVLHWPFAFPQVFARGGFDVVLGNPPWERIKLQEQEFFAQRAPAVAQARNKAERERAIREMADSPLGSPERAVYNEFVASKQHAEAASVFCHAEARYPLTGVGDVNTYALLAETAYKLVAPSGRAGLVLPTGIVTDDTTKAFFGRLVTTQCLRAVLAYENEERVFESVHHAFKFCLLCFSGSSVETAADLVFFARQPAQIYDTRRHFRLTAEEFGLINPNTRTCPIFRSERDAELTKKIYRHVPVLIDETKPAGEGNPWGLSFMRMLDMANDSGLFLEVPTSDALPLYEAKMVHQFDHRWATYESTSGGPEARDVTAEEKAHPEFVLRPRYWVPGDVVRAATSRVPKTLLNAYRSGDVDLAMQALSLWMAGYYLNQAEEQKGNELLLRSVGGAGTTTNDLTNWLAVKGLEQEFPLTDAEVALIQECDSGLELAEALIEARTPKWFIGWRDICRATDERTVIASVIPPVGVNHKTPLFRFNCITAPYAAALLANESALVVDFVARQKVGGTSLGIFIVKQLPVLSPSRYTAADLDFIVPRVLELTYTAYDLTPWARDLGYEGEPFGWDPERRAVLRAELDAYYARLYGLTRDELRYVLDPADVMGPDYPSETFRVLKNNEIREFGEYRTRRLVLEAWDQLFNGKTLAFVIHDYASVHT
jgi:hypothetical protein